jgi:hypothetical protein
MSKSFKKFRESTSAYKKSLAKIADKKKKAGMSSSDQNKMGKLAALMKKQKREDVEQVDEGISSDLKKFKKTVVQKKKDYKYDKKNAAYLKRSRARDQKEIDLVVKGDSRSKNGKSDNPHKAAHIKRALARADSRIKNWKLPRLPEEVELDENRLLKVNKLSSVEYQRVKKLKGFDKSKYTWDSKQQLYIKEEVEQVDEGVGGYSLKRGKTSVIKGKGDGDDISITHYDILLKGKKVGEIKHNNYFGNIDGKLNGKELPDLEKYSKGSSGASGALHSFLKTSQGKKFTTESVDEGVFSKYKAHKKAKVQKKKDAEYDKKNAAFLKRSGKRDSKGIDIVMKSSERGAKGDFTSFNNPSRTAHNKRMLDKTSSRIKNGHKLPRLPEEVEQVDEARAPSTVKHKGKTYYQTGKKGKDMKTGHPSFEYSSDMDGDDVRVWYNTRTKKLTVESFENVDEALSHAQRIKASLRMKKMKSRIKIGRERAMRKTPNMDVVKKRAFRQARLAVLKKMTKGMDKGDVSFAKRQDLEKRLDKKRPLIQRLAKRLIPNVRKADRARRASKGEK